MTRSLESAPMFAATIDRPAPVSELGPATLARVPRVLVFDSGLGGLTVLSEIVRAVPGSDLVFVADDAVFPYGRLSEAALIARVMAVMEEHVARLAPDVVVIACHTASTLVLPPMRARWPALAVVGTVPAIKPAAALSQSRLVSVLATPGTVERQYTRDLVLQFAGDCGVTLVASSRLASLVEAAMRGEPVENDAIAAEIAPAFVERDGRRTDVVVLACTHYPLMLDRFGVLAPWPVTWIDPAPAIARRVANVASAAGFATTEPRDMPRAIPAVFTSGAPPGGPLTAFLRKYGVAAGETG